MAIDEPEKPSPERLLIVVGFDGSEAATRALDAATRLMANRVGSIEVVFVAHTPPASELSAAALLETLNAFDAVEHDLAAVVRARLEGVEPHWGSPRDGLITDELAAVADELRRDNGDHAVVVIVVGSATHTYHHFVGSVPVGLVRHAKYPVVVVP